jgi:hypothetical protein
VVTSVQRVLSVVGTGMVNFPLLSVTAVAVGFSPEAIAPG